MAKTDAGGDDRAEVLRGVARKRDIAPAQGVTPLQDPLPCWTAEPPRGPAPTRALEREREARRSHIEAREEVERRSAARGLLLLAALALVVSVARAGVDRVFVHGWWKQW